MVLIDKQTKKDYSQSYLQVILPSVNYAAQLLNIHAIFEQYYPDDVGILIFEDTG